MSTRNATVKMAGPAVVQCLCSKNSTLSVHLPCMKYMRVSYQNKREFRGGALLSCNLYAIDRVSYVDQVRASGG
jgi:hypothetical protein